MDKTLVVRHAELAQWKKDCAELDFLLKRLRLGIYSFDIFLIGGLVYIGSLFVQS